MDTLDHCSRKSGGWLQMNQLSLRNNWPVEVRDFQRITDHFRGIYKIYLNWMKQNRKMSTCKPISFWTLGSWPTMPKNFPSTTLDVPQLFEPSTYYLFLTKISFFLLSSLGILWVQINFFPSQNTTNNEIIKYHSPITTYWVIISMLNSTRP